MAISSYLKEAVRQRDILKQNIQDKGVSVLNKSTFNDLTGRVSEINTKIGAQSGVWTPLVTTDSFEVSGFDFLPAKLAICCENVLRETQSTIKEFIMIGLINIEIETANLELLVQNSDGTVKLADYTVNAEVTVIHNDDDTYGIGISFKTVNEALNCEYKFSANSPHIWCVAEEGWIS